MSNERSGSFAYSNLSKHRSAGDTFTYAADGDPEGDAELIASTLEYGVRDSRKI